MDKKYIVRLSDRERQELISIVKKLSGTSQKGRRAQILLKADADGPGWTDARIGDAFNCRTKTVENIRQRLVLNGFREAVDGKQREKPPTPGASAYSEPSQLHSARLVRKVIGVFLAPTGSACLESNEGRDGRFHFVSFIFLS